MHRRSAPPSKSRSASPEETEIYHLAVLHELEAIGRDIARIQAARARREARRQAKAQSAPEQPDAARPAAGRSRPQAAGRRPPYLRLVVSNDG